MQEFKVSVSEILGHPGLYKDIKVRRTLPPVGNALARVQARPIDARLRAESVVEGVLVTGPVTAPVAYECARCLTPVTSDVVLDVCELFVAPGHEAPPEEEAYEVTGLEIDLEPMLRDNIALALPLNPVCRDDCLGICARCGRDLNQGPCDCSDEELDPRWAELAALRDKLV
ncbi:MAG: YceD family protein [Actinomycetota bacterium]